MSIALPSNPPNAHDNSQRLEEMSEVERVSIECPKCHAVCKVTPTEYEPGLDHFHCEACGVYGTTNDIPKESTQLSTMGYEEYRKAFANAWDYQRGSLMLKDENEGKAWKQAVAEHFIDWAWGWFVDTGRLKVTPGSAQHQSAKSDEIFVSVDDWPKCIVEGCSNASCLDESEWCFPHMMMNRYEKEIAALKEARSLPPNGLRTEILKLKECIKELQAENARLKVVLRKIADGPEIPLTNLGGKWTPKAMAFFVAEWSQRQAKAALEASGGTNEP